MGQLYPRPPHDLVVGLYMDNYFAHGNALATGGYADYAAMQREHRRASRKLLAKIAQLHPPPGRLFDLGCAFGHFLEAAREAGWTVAGSDLSPVAVEVANARVGNVVCQPVEELSGCYDVITAWDVLEHLEDPLAALMAIRGALSPDGILAFSTPDTESWDAQLLRGRWYGYTKVPEHLLFFNQRSIRELLRATSMELITYQPWGWVRSGRFIADRICQVIFGRENRLLRAMPKWLAEAVWFIPGIARFGAARRAT